MTDSVLSVIIYGLELIKINVFSNTMNYKPRKHREHRECL